MTVPVVKYLHLKHDKTILPFHLIQYLVRTLTDLTSKCRYVAFILKFFLCIFVLSFFFTDFCKHLCSTSVNCEREMSVVDYADIYINFIIFYKEKLLKRWCYIWWWFCDCMWCL